MHAIGVDIGGTKIAAGVVDDEGRILAQTRRSTDASDADSVDAGVIEVVRELSGLVRHRCDRAGRARVRRPPTRRPCCCARTCRGATTRCASGSRRAWATDVPIVVENDANAAGWAEFRFGVGRDVQDMLLLTIGTGLGGALVVGGRLVRGAYGVAAEVGHMRVVPDGHLCGCGLHGCWEQYASGRALVRSARHGGGEPAGERRPDGRAVRRRQDQGPRDHHGGAGGRPAGRLPARRARSLDR